MTRAIQQSVEFRVSPEELFEIYLDSKKHSAATNTPARPPRRAPGLADLLLEAVEGLSVAAKKGVRQH